MNYGQLKQMVRDYLEDAIIPSAAMDSAARSVESRVNNEIRSMDMVLFASSTTKAGQNKYALPQDYLSLRSVEWNGAPVRYITPVEGTSCYDYKAYTLIGGWIQLYPKPTADSATEDNLVLTYYNRVPPLVKDSNTNWLLSKAQEVYINGMLADLSAFTFEADVLPYWKSKYDESMMQLNNSTFDTMYSGSNLDYRDLHYA